MNSQAVNQKLSQRREMIRSLLVAEPQISHREVARRLGLPKTWTGTTAAEIRAELPAQRHERELEIAPIPEGDFDVNTLIDHQTQRFLLRKREMDARKLTQVRVKTDGPIGITWFGDPHIDDDGCNWPRLRADMDLVLNTEGMYAANIGDTNNNWVGRLARLWEDQSTTGQQAWRLVEWFVNSLPWLIFLNGNHGAWSGSGDPVKWMLKGHSTIADDFEARLELAFPNGSRTRIFARHDFPGHSQWNQSHGLAKAASMHGYDDSLLVAGHRHVSSYSIIKNPQSGVVSHLLRVAGYKAIDKYARTNFFTDQMLSESAVTIIDPRFPATSPRHIKTFLSTEEGADYLTFLRKQK